MEWIIGNVFCVRLLLCGDAKYGYGDFDGDSSEDGMYR
jgi:hypothetical protein